MATMVKLTFMLTRSRETPAFTVCLLLKLRPHPCTRSWVFSKTNGVLSSVFEKNLPLHIAFSNRISVE